MPVLLEMTGTVQRLFEKDVGAAGSLLRNFSSARGKWIACRRMWCGSCYTSLLGDSFPMDDEGEVCVKPGLNKAMKVLTSFIRSSVICTGSGTSREEIR